MTFESNKTNIKKRHLSFVEPPERDECFNCFKSKQRYCSDSKFDARNQGYCCNPAETDCTNEDLPLFCESEESFENSELFNEAVADRFYRAMCPEI